MKKYTEEELQNILDNHKLWLYGEGGKRAVLTNAVLSNARLSDADLSDADLSHADLSYADLRGANLFGTDLTNATFDNTLILGKPVNKAPVQLYDYPPYNILITDTMMQIGCKVHSIDAWLAFTVEEINEMDRYAKWFYEKRGDY